MKEYVRKALEYLSRQTVPVPPSCVADAIYGGGEYGTGHFRSRQGAGRVGVSILRRMEAMGFVRRVLRQKIRTTFFHYFSGWVISEKGRRALKGEGDGS
jgi:ribosomal protein S19E (S16A)